MSPLRLFDTHSHLAGAELKAEAPALVERALKEGVGGMSFIATDQTSLADAELLATQFQSQHPDKVFVWSAGVHPHEAKDLTLELKEQVRESAQKAHAIGETGLDFYYDFSDREAQIASFRFHIQLAKSLKKPLVIHCRQSAKDILQVLDEESIQEHPNPGVLHCFTEDDAIAREFLARGFFISFSGILTFPKAEALRATSKWIPLDRLLIETDAPYLSPVPQRGRRNEPAFLRSTFETLSQHRAEKREHLAEHLWRNSCKLFSKV